MRVSHKTCTLIPTPRYLRYPGGEPKCYSRDKPIRVMLCGKANPQTEFAVDFLRKGLAKMNGVRCQVVRARSDQIAKTSPLDLLLCADGNAALTRLVGSSLARFEGIAEKQGYAILSTKDSPVVLYARSPIGLLYAIATFLQLAVEKKGSLFLDPVEIRDWPEYEYRGNNWLLTCELYSWSYDRGDGRKAYEKRILRKLDLCAMHKINLVTFDGFGWHPERFRGYGAMMRRLARAARLRGIKLQFDGYGSSYGMQGDYDGKIFRNRKRYPDGEIYACCGMPGISATEISRTMGTCLSNQALLKLKKEELATFVQAVEPGMLYIHNVDAMGIKESAEVWHLRCPTCRKKWPSDEVTAEDGMAGAFAAFYDALAKEINRVRKPDSDYIARRDCMIMMVSPAYTSMEEDDRAWRLECDYFGVLSKLCREKNIVFGLREQFCNVKDSSLRYPQMRKSISRKGGGHRLANFYVHGGSGFMNNYPFLATPVMNRYFKGADIIMNANGNAYQEPQQLLHAEYCWNPHGSAFHVEPLAKSRAEMKKRYMELSRARARPAGIFGKGGFLDCACERLYGFKAGPKMADVFRIIGRHSIKSLFPNVFQLPNYERPSVFMPLRNKLAPPQIFPHAGIYWQEKINADGQTRIKMLVRAYREMIDMNHRAAKLARHAASDCLDSGAEEDVLWMADTLEYGVLILEAGIRYLLLLSPAQRFAAKGHGKRAEILKRIRSEERRLIKLENKFKTRVSGKPICPKGSDLTPGPTAVQGLRKELSIIRNTVKTGLWPKPESEIWW